MFKYLKKHWSCILYGVALFGFTCYLLMDTFLISQVYRVAEKQKGRILPEKISRKKLWQRHQKPLMKMERFLLL